MRKDIKIQKTLHQIAQNPKEHRKHKDAHGSRVEFHRSRKYIESSIDFGEVIVNWLLVLEFLDNFIDIILEILHGRNANDIETHAVSLEAVSYSPIEQLVLLDSFIEELLVLFQAGIVSDDVFLEKLVMPCLPRAQSCHSALGKLLWNQKTGTKPT